MGSPAEELVEEVDADGAVVRVVTRGEMRAGRLRHRCVFIVVRDSDGRVLVHQRSPHKDMWPSRWDLAAGGVCDAGESWDAAARRELAEEVGVDAVPFGLGPQVAYEDADVVEVCRVYIVTHDGSITPTDGEVVAWEWIPLAELETRVAADPAGWCADSVAVVLPRLRAGVEGVAS